MLVRVIPRNVLISLILILHAVLPYKAAFSDENLSPRVTELIEKLAHSSNSTDRAKAAWALGAIGPQAASAVPALIEMLNNQEPELRIVAAWALGAIGPQAASAVPALIQALKEDQESRVRENAAWALGAIGPTLAPTVPSKGQESRVRENTQSKPIVYSLMAFYFAIAIPLAGLIAGIDRVYSIEDKRAFAQSLNNRFLRLRDSVPSPPVFKLVFDTLENILHRLFGPRVASPRLILFIAICSAILFWVYLLIISLNQGSNFVYRMFENYRSTIPFLIITIFSLITDVLSIAQTRLFLRIFKLYPTGINFLLLAYSDAILKITVFILVFSLGIAFSLLFIDATLYKDIPVSLDWQPPTPRFFPASRHAPTMNLRIAWPIVNDPVYSDYRHDVGIGIGVTTYGRTLNVDDAHNEEDLLRKHLREVRGVEFERLATPRQWPMGCVGHGCLMEYTYIAHVRPFYRIADFGDLWGHGIVKAFTTVLVVASGHLLFFDPTWVYIMSAQSVFFDPNPLYISLSKTTSDERFGEMWADLVTQTNPLFKPAIPIPPFFISSLFLSFIIYSSALSFKLITLSAEWSRKFLIKKGIKVSEKIPFTQAAVLILISIAAAGTPIIIMYH